EPLPSDRDDERHGRRDDRMHGQGPEPTEMSLFDATLEPRDPGREQRPEPRYADADRDGPRPERAFAKRDLVEQALRQPVGGPCAEDECPATPALRGRFPNGDRFGKVMKERGGGATRHRLVVGTLIRPDRRALVAVAAACPTRPKVSSCGSSQF